MEEKKLTTEAESTIRFQLLFGTGCIAVALVVFWICSQVWTMVDLKYAIAAIGAFVAILWLRDGLTMLADVAIIVMKLKGIK